MITSSPDRYHVSEGLSSMEISARSLDSELKLLVSEGLSSMEIHISL